ncbi:hypothetical protein ACQJBY_006688 [Aegilops geniculata]
MGASEGERKGKMAAAVTTGEETLRAAGILIKHDGSRRKASWKNPEGQVISVTTATAPRASASSATRSSPVAPPCPTSPRSIPPFVDRAAPSPFASSVAAPYPTSLTWAHATSPLLSLSPIRPVPVCAHLPAAQWRHAVMVADEEGVPVQRMATVALSHVGGRRLRSMAEERVDQGSG